MASMVSASLVVGGEEIDLSVQMDQVAVHFRWVHEFANDLEDA